MTESVEETAGPAGAQSPGTAAPAPEGGYPAARLRLLQDETAAGPDRRAALARLTDDWLAGLLARHGAAAGLSGTALVAVGGYGRGELSPRSDLDLLLLHDGRADAGALAALADHLWYPVWDLGLDLDHSVRTPAQARKAAREDLKVQLGLLDARHLAGDPDLTAALRTAAYADWRESAPKRLPELHDLCQERAERQGELQYLLEPDLKEARGGLRDATALRAVAASWLADAPRGGLEAARTRLLDTRDALHLTTGRATDRLSLQEQDQVADRPRHARRGRPAAADLRIRPHHLLRGRCHLARGRPGAARPLRQAHAARAAARPYRGQGRALPARRGRRRTRRRGGARPHRTPRARPGAGAARRGRRRPGRPAAGHPRDPPLRHGHRRAGRCPCPGPPRPASSW